MQSARQERGHAVTLHRSRPEMNRKRSRPKPSPTAKRKRRQREKARCEGKCIVCCTVPAGEGRSTCIGCQEKAEARRARLKPPAARERAESRLDRIEMILDQLQARVDALES